MFGHKDDEIFQNMFYYDGNYPGQTEDDFEQSGLMDFRIRVSVSTHIGMVRGKHEDNFYLEGLELKEMFRNDFSATYTITNPNNMTFAVFDGMGGAFYGDRASKIAADTLRKYELKFKMADGTRRLDQVVSGYTSEANNAILDMLAESKSPSGGTTLAMLHFLGGLAKIYYLGDSRVYQFSPEKGLHCLTRDHTVANQKVDAAIYTEEEAKRSPDQHRLTLFIGADKKRKGLNADSRRAVSFEVGTKFLLCSDGVTNMCTDEEIANSLSEQYYNDASALIQTALQNGGTDNATAIVIEIMPGVEDE